MIEQAEESVDESGLINPALFPCKSADLDTSLIVSSADGVAAIGADVLSAAQEAETAWSGVAAPGVFETPDRDAVYDLMTPAVDSATTFESVMSRASTALSTFASALDGIKPTLSEFEQRAIAFRDRAQQGYIVTAQEANGWLAALWEDEWDKPTHITWQEHTPAVDQNKALLEEYSGILEQISTAATTCGNDLRAELTGGTAERFEVITAELIAASPEFSNWGQPVVEDRNFFESVGAGLSNFWDSTWTGAASLIGRDPTTGDWSWDTAFQSWVGVGDFALSTVMATSPVGQLMSLAPGPLGDFARDRMNVAATSWGSLIGWDHQAAMNGGNGWWKYEEDGVAAFTESLANVGSFFIPAAGVAGGSARLASTAARTSSAALRGPGGGSLLIRGAANAAEFALPGGSHLVAGGIRVVELSANGLRTGWRALTDAISPTSPRGDVPSSPANLDAPVSRTPVSDALDVEPSPAPRPAAPEAADAGPASASPGSTSPASASDSASAGSGAGSRTPTGASDASDASQAGGSSRPSNPADVSDAADDAASPSPAPRTGDEQPDVDADAADASTPNAPDVPDADGGQPARDADADADGQSAGGASGVRPSPVGVVDEAAQASTDSGATKPAADESPDPLDSTAADSPSSVTPDASEGTGSAATSSGARPNPVGLADEATQASSDAVKPDGVEGRNEAPSADAEPDVVGSDVPPPVEAPSAAVDAADDAAPTSPNGADPDASPASPRVADDAVDAATNAAPRPEAGVDGDVPSAGRLNDVVDTSPDGSSADSADVSTQPGVPDSASQAPDGATSAPTILRDGAQFGPDGRLKPNISYTTGEFDYVYTTNSDGFISSFRADQLHLTERTDRLSHDPNTPGKLPDDHAGHLAGDRFGGSPRIDNLVSQLKGVNLSAYRIIENRWARALAPNQPGGAKDVSVDVQVETDPFTGRPVQFNIKWWIDGQSFSQVIPNI